MHKPAPGWISHPKKRGEWVELQFMARAALHKLVVSRPWGDSARYDFVVQGLNGKLHRVQVKSASTQKQRAFHAKLVPLSSWPMYTPKEIDFFAFYIVPADAWFIVPVSIVRRSIYLDPTRPDSKYFPYLEAWELLVGAAA